MMTKYSHLINKYISNHFYPISNFRELIVYYLHLIIFIGGLGLFWPLKNYGGNQLLFGTVLVFCIYLILCWISLYVRDKYYTKHLYIKNFDFKKLLVWAKNMREKEYNATGFRYTNLFDKGFVKMNDQHHIYYKKIRVRTFLNMDTSYSKKNIIVMMVFWDELDLDKVLANVFPDYDIFVFMFTSAEQPTAEVIPRVTINKDRQISVQFISYLVGKVLYKKPIYLHRIGKNTVNSKHHIVYKKNVLFPDYYLTRIVTNEFYHALGIGWFRLFINRSKIY